MAYRWDDAKALLTRCIYCVIVPACDFYHLNPRTSVHEVKEAIEFLKPEKWYWRNLLWFKEWSEGHAG